MAKTERKIRLTDAKAKAIPPGAQRLLVWDEAAPGLALAITPAGVRSWRFHYRANGCLRVLTIGRLEAYSVVEARKAAADLLGQVARGGDPQADKMRGRRAETFRDLHDQYLKFARVRNKSWKQAATLVEKNVMPVWGYRRARDIARADVRDVMRRLTDAGSPILANQVLASMSAVFAWALREEVADLTVNPCVGVTRNATLARDTTLTESQVPKFWRQFELIGGIEGAILKTILLTGQRPGEVCAMRWEHISDNWWTMPGKPDAATGWPGTKNGQSHTIWLTAAVRGIIAEASGDRKTGFAFTRNVKPLAGVDAAMRAICASLGVAASQAVRPHDLRRSFASTVTRLGHGRDAMDRLLNHKEGGVTDVYDRNAYAAENKKVMESVGRCLMALVDGTTNQGAEIIELRA